MKFNLLVQEILNEAKKPKWLEKAEVKAEVKAEIKKEAKVSDKEKKKVGMSKNPFVKKIGDRYKGLSDKSKKK